MSLVYVHSPMPPFVRIAGPVPTVPGIAKNIGLSEEPDAQITVAIGDLDATLSWIRPGMCWVIDQADIGEDLWGGFVSPQQIPMGADSLTVSLVGAKEGLLSTELTLQLPARTTRGFAVRAAINAAAGKVGGVLPGIIEQSGAAIEVEPRGETVSAFISTLRSDSGTADWRERVTVSDNQLKFFIDFGTLERRTDIVLRRDDLVAGNFTSNPIIASLTEFGAGQDFSSRAASSVVAAQARSALTSPLANIQPGSQKYIKLIAERDIGPAALRHLTEIRDRVDKGVTRFTPDRHEGLLRGVDEFLLTLDANKANARKLKLGDIVRLEVVDWVDGFDVSADIHIRHIEAHDSDNTRDIVGARVF